MSDFLLIPVPLWKMLLFVLVAYGVGYGVCERRKP
jgi:hypothetical protein